jgi:foldase protein PrsA
VVKLAKSKKVETMDHIENQGMDEITIPSEHKKAKKKAKKESINKTNNTAIILWAVIILLVIAALVVYNKDVIFGDTFKAAAKINGEKITMKQLNNQYLNLPEQYQQRLTKEQVLDRMINFTVMRQAAEKEGYSVSSDQMDSVIKGIAGATPEDEFKAQIKEQYKSYDNFKRELRDTILVQDYVAANVASLNITEEELNSLYEQYKAYISVEYVRASHILICYKDANSCEGTMKKDEAYNKAAEIKAQINDTNFAYLSQQYSTDVLSGSRGGDLGWFTKGQMVGPFEDATFALEVGKVSDIVETQFGYHLIRLTARRAAENITFDKAKPFLKFTLFTQKQQLNTGDFLALVSQKMSEAKIEKLYKEPIKDIGEEDIIEVSNQEELEAAIKEKLGENAVITVDKKGKYTSCMKENGIETKAVLYYATGNEKSETMKAYFAGVTDVMLVEKSSEQAAALSNCFEGFNKVIVPQLVCVNDGTISQGMMEEKNSILFVKVC